MTKRIRTSIATSGAVVAALIASVGCGGSSSTLSESGGIALADLPPKYAAELCAAYTRCVGEEVYQIFANGADCIHDTEQRILNGEFAQYQAHIDAGTMRYDAKKAQGCLDALHALSCASLNERPILACKDALDGRVAPGGECELNAECAGAAFCDAAAAACPGHCSALLLAGSDCSADDQCASGLQCSTETKKCVQPANLGDACEHGAPPCAPGLLCIGKDDKAATSGTCKSADATFSTAEGAACDPSVALCALGQSCAVDALTANGATFKCVKTEGYASGGACRLAIPEACAAGSYCKTAGATVVIDGTCAALPSAGEACGTNLLSSTICGSGLGCVAGKCQALVANGVSCTGDGMCFSKHCVAGGCQAKLPCN